MKSHVESQFIREVEKEFNTIYPYLKIELVKDQAVQSGAGYMVGEEDVLKSRAKHLLENEIHVNDQMKVSELETALQEILASRVQIFRRSGNFWIETTMTRNWTLKQQNDQGRELI